MICLKHLRNYTKNQCLIGLRHQSMVGLNNSRIDPLDRKFQELDVNCFKDIIDSNINDKTIRDQIQRILNEYEYEKEISLRVPTTLTAEQMKDLLELPKITERQKLMDFLFSVEMKKLRQKLKKKSIESLRPERNEVKPRGLWDENQRLLYGLTHNSMFQRISKSSANRLYCHRLRTAALFGPKIVIDLDFDKYMKKYESRRLLQQLAFLYNYNKYGTKQPFDLHFVNCDQNQTSIREMSRYLPKYNCDDFFVSMHFNRSYLDVFPKQRLVYLSPHSEETLTEVSDEDIYIIGGLVDKSYREPITAIKAREDGIRSAKLPIHSYIKYIKGSVHLCINQVLAILHDWKQSRDWEQTFRNNLPFRKMYTDQQIEAMESPKQSKYV